MDLILGLTVFLVVLALLIAGSYSGGPIYERLRRLELDRRSFICKLMTAFLSGFAVFILISERVHILGQKVTLCIICMLLIFANIFLSHKTDKDGEEE
ncbi:MAG: hypothetical protein GY757_25725 [bacterium]|nr:hypothetical protein [bacterium]